MENRGRAAGVLSTREVTGRGGRRHRPIPDLQVPSSLRRQYCRIISGRDEKEEVWFYLCGTVFTNISDIIQQA